MKIDAQNTTNNNPRFAQKEILNAGFLEWIKSPSQSMNGSEYYCLHQNELQQSGLHFNSQIHAPKLQNASLLQLENPAFEDTTITETINKEIAFIRLTQTFIKSANNNVSRNTPSLINDTTPTAIKIKMKHYPMTATTVLNNKCSTTQLDDLEHRAKYDRNFKNHRLFIHHNQAELSFCARYLKPHELKKIVQLIKNTLKQKGLILQSLIINGVHQ